MLAVLNALFFLFACIYVCYSSAGKKLHTRIARDLNSQILLLNKLSFFFTAPKVNPYLNGRACTETAGKIAFITLHAGTVPFDIKTSIVQLHTMSTTTTGRFPSDAHTMASSLEWQVPTVLQQEIAGEVLNLMNLLRWLCSVCLILALKCYTYDDHLDDNTEELATGNRTSSWGSFC